MLRRIAVALVLGVYIGPVSAGEYAFCLLTNKVAAAGKLREYSNKQIENGLCMTSKEIMAAIVNDDSFKQEVCTQAAGEMIMPAAKKCPFCKSEL